MALTGIATAYDDFTTVDTVQRMPLGTYVFAGDKRYVYVQGVSSGAAGAWVTFTLAGVTTLTVADANGLVGVMMSALDATSDYGFIQVFGINTNCTVISSVTAGAALYLTSTPGSLDGADVAGDLVIGAMPLTDDAANVATVFLNHPYVIDAAID